MKKEKRVQFPATLPEEVKKAFDNFCKERSINKSRLVEWLLLQYIVKEKSV